MKYKVGDKVRVREDLKDGDSYGSCYFDSNMAKLKGNIVTIRAVCGDFYKIKESVYNWTDEMLEPVIINWDKAKEDMRIEEVYINPFCESVHRLRNEKNCHGRMCSECKEWLKQPYEEPSILDEAEKKYLSAVIRPFRNKVSSIHKTSYKDGYEYIAISIKDEYETELPNFKLNSMYIGMELDKEYTLEELGL